MHHSSMYKLAVHLEGEKIIVVLADKFHMYQDKIISLSGVQEQ